MSASHRGGQQELATVGRPRQSLILRLDEEGKRAAPDRLKPVDRMFVISRVELLDRETLRVGRPQPSMHVCLLCGVMSISGSLFVNVDKGSLEQAQEKRPTYRNGAEYSHRNLQLIR